MSMPGCAQNSLGHRTLHPVIPIPYLTSVNGVKAAIRETTGAASLGRLAIADSSPPLVGRPNGYSSAHVFPRVRPVRQELGTCPTSAQVLSGTLVR